MWVILLSSIATALALPADMPMPYDFAYGVNGGEFGDIKAHKEVTSVDGRTEGEYRWLQPNGLYIVTRYFVDGNSGYQATVSEEAGPEVTNFYSNSQDEQISSAQQSFDSQQTLTSQQNFNNQQSQTSQQTFSQQVTSNQQSQSSSASSVQGSAGLIVTSQAANLGGVSSLENSQQSSAFDESGATSSSQQLSTGFSQVNTESQTGSVTDLRQGAALSSVSQSVSAGSQSVSAGSQSVSSGSNELDQITTVAQIQVRPAVITFTNEASALNNIDGSRVTESSQSGAVSLSSNTASSSSSQSATSGSSAFTQSSSAGLISGSLGATQSSSVGVSAESSLTEGSSQSAQLSQSQNSRNRVTSSAASSSSSFSSNQQSSSSFSSNQQSSNFNQQLGAAVLAGDVKSIAVILAGSPEAAKLRKN
ncbi:uncharacterized protein LOC135225627 [Macrobrachium nipponense]|uniref:uncharacterized protein LOC135225627 n=1 Tax=Macrobrachium nipponense TaxID=159736 RepID=UPI0030C7C792